MKLLKIHTIHPDDVMQDSVMWVNAELVTAIQEPTPVDRKRREEINSILLTKMGGYAVTEKPDELIEELKSVDYTS